MPIAVTVILAVLLLLLLCLCLTIRLTVEYHEAVVLKWHILCFSFTLYPKTEKHVHPRKYTKRALARRERRAHRKQEKKARRLKKRAAQHTPKKSGKPRGGLHENIILVRALVAALLRQTGKRLHLRAAKAHIRVATGDAATTAILYGAISASLAYLLALLDRVTRLKTTPKSVSVVADYLAEHSCADIKLVFSMRVFEALALLFHAALAVVQQRRKQKQANKTT